MVTEPQLTSRHLSIQQYTEKEIPVCGIDTNPNVWEGGRANQASKLAEQNSSKQMAKPLQT